MVVPRKSTGGQQAPRQQIAATVARVASATHWLPKVSRLMVPVDKVVTMEPEGSIVRAMNLMATHKIGTVVVTREPRAMPIGVVTERNIVDAYRRKLGSNCCVESIMDRNIATIRGATDRDEAALEFRDNDNPYLFVVDDNHNFKGFITSWDITTACAMDQDKRY